MPSAASKVLKYLEELHALEGTLVTTLTVHIAVTPRSEYRDLLERHRYETRTQLQRIEQRLTELGRSRSLVHVVYGAAQDVIGQGISLVLAPLSMLRGTGTGGDERLLMNAKDEAASEALEIVSYDVLEAVADAVGDTKTAVLAREHRAQEERFLADLRKLIGALATDVVGAEPAGQPSAAPPTVVEDAGEPRGATAGDDHALAIAGYELLTVAQVLPKLKTLTAGQLAAVDGYERAGRNRKRILDRTAALRAKKVDEQLAKL